MAQQHSDGYEHGVLPGPWTANDASSPSGTLVNDTVNPGSGDYGIRAVMASGEGVEVDELFDFNRVSGQAMNFGLSIEIDDWSAVSDYRIYIGVDGTTDSFFVLDIDPTDGSADFYGRNDATIGGSPVDSAPASTFGVDGARYDVEVRCHISASGYYQLAVNGVTVIDHSGDTVYGSGTSNDFGWGLIATASAALNAAWDDLRIGDSMTLQGVKHHHAILSPTSSIEADGTGSDGNQVDNYLMVDDVPLDDGAEYVDLTGNGDRERYGIADPVDLPDAIDHVQVWAVLSNPDVGAITAVGFIESNASESAGAAVAALGVATLVKLAQEALDPDGSVAWTPAAVAALTAGHELVSGGA